MLVVDRGIVGCEEGAERGGELGGRVGLAFGRDEEAGAVDHAAPAVADQVRQVVAERDPAAMFGQAVAFGSG